MNFMKHVCVGMEVGTEGWNLIHSPLNTFREYYHSHGLTTTYLQVTMETEGEETRIIIHHVSPHKPCTDMKKRVKS